MIRSIIGQTGIGDSGSATSWPSAGGDFESQFTDSDPLAQVALQYLSALEQGQKLSPEDFAQQCDCQDDRLLESLRSIRLLFEAADDLGAELRRDELDDQPTDEMLGRILGDYRLIREIGRGGMGLVFEAEQISLGRRVAVKVLPTASMLDDRQVARFAIESYAAGRLQHPHIVPIYGVGSCDSTYYYSMPLIDCTPLEVPMNIGRVARLAIEVAGALQHAHELGVIHRDIKPSNLLQDHHGKVWITDFGLARCNAGDTVTITGAVVGTLRYMSPEQASGNPHAIDHRTDIYALGVTLYELLTGRCPYDASDRATFLAELEKGEPAYPRRLRKEIPVDLETIILTAMARYPDQRYATAQDMVDDLRRFQAGEVIQARRPRLVDRVAKWTRRNRRWAVVALATWIFISLGTTLAAILLVGANRQTGRALAESRHSLAEADAFYGQARDVIDHLAVDIAPRLANIPEASDVHRELLQDTLHYYRGFMQQVASNEHRQRDLAETQVDVAEIAVQLGAHEEAALAYRQAADVLGRLPDSLASEALCWNNLGGLLAQHEQPDRAYQAYSNAIDCLRQLQTGVPKREHQRQLALTMAARANLPSADGQPDRDGLLSALQLQREMLAAAPDTSTADGPTVTGTMRRRLQHDTLVTLGLLAAVARDGQDRTHIDYSAQAVALALELRHSHAGQSNAARLAMLEDCYTALCNHVILLESEQRLAEAIDTSQQAIDLGQELCRLRPNGLRYLHDLAIAEQQLSKLFRQSGDIAQQQVHLARVQRLYQKLVEGHPDQPAHRVALLEACQRLKQVAQITGRRDLFQSASLTAARQTQWLEAHAAAATDRGNSSPRRPKTPQG